MSDLPKTVARVIGWTALQALVYLAVFEAGRAAWAAVHGWQGDTGRGLLWWSAFWLFGALALVANAILDRARFGSARTMRRVVWAVALVPLAVLTGPAASSVPRAVLLVWLAAVAAVAVREGPGRLARGPRSSASR